MERLFNLPAPPGFRGLDVHRRIDVYRRHLPHWRQRGATYFATFNLADAIPVAKRRELESIRRAWENSTSEPRTEADWIDCANRQFSAAEKILDSGFGKCLLRKPEYADELRRAILHFHDSRYDVGCFVTMANHCHLVIRPFDAFRLEDILGGIKRTVAAYMNRCEHQEGQLWQQESYDRIVRDEEHLYQVVQYIGNNPRKAKIAPALWDRWLNPKWQECGWHFEEPT